MRFLLKRNSDFSARPLMQQRDYLSHSTFSPTGEQAEPAAELEAMVLASHSSTEAKTRSRSSQVALAARWAMLKAATPIRSQGITGGYLGIGFDEFGNFSSGTEGRVGGKIGGAKVPDSVAVRGSQLNNYNFLTGTSTLATSLDVPAAQGGTQANALKHAKIDLSPTGQLTVKVDLNGNNAFDPAETLINYNVITEGKNGNLPSTMRFGFGRFYGCSN